MPLQVVFDCADPHAQARFWAAATGYDVEDNHDLVLRMVEAGHTTLEESAVQVDGRWAWRDAAACSPPSEPAPDAPVASGPRLLFQRVPEPKTVKNRVHVDLDVSDSREVFVDRLLALGATRLWEASQGPNSWVTLADPEGNEFCVG